MAKCVTGKILQRVLLCPLKTGTFALQTSKFLPSKSLHQDKSFKRALTCERLLRGHYLLPRVFALSLTRAAALSAVPTLRHIRFWCCQIVSERALSIMLRSHHALAQALGRLLSGLVISGDSAKHRATLRGEVTVVRNSVSSSAVYPNSHHMKSLERQPVTIPSGHGPAAFLGRILSAFGRILSNSALTSEQLKCPCSR